MMTTLRLSGIVAAAAFAGVLSVGSASAATYTSTGSCNVTDMSATADQCFGLVLPTSANDSESLLNNNTFGSDTGLFGYTDWDFLAKQETPPKAGEPAVTGTDIGLSVTPTGGASSGDWSVNTGALDSFARLVFILKAGNSFSSYLYEPGSNAGSSGSWATIALGNQDLSHLSIYTSPSPVPVPAAVWLFGTALLGFIGMSRRTKV
jgi:hypothetical protein